MIIDFVKYIFKFQYSSKYKLFKWGQFLILICFYYVITLCLVNFIKLFSNIPDNRNSLVFSESYFKSFLFLVILSPIIEEITHRLWIRKNILNTIVSLVCCIVLVIYFIFKKEVSLLSFKVILLLILCCVIYISNIVLDKRDSKIVLYISSILFGLSHITNFTDTLSIPIYMIPLLIFPQLILGLMAGYLRLTYGFIYCVLCHFIINLITFTIMGGLLIFN